MRIKALSALALALLAGACGRPAPAPVPRPRAYPRIDVPAALYDTLRVGGAEFLVNAACRVQADGRAVTVRYPGGMGALYCTFTPVTEATRRAVADNRAERLSLNTGGARTATTAVDGPGWHGVLVETPAGTPTPVQFLATGPGVVASGTWYVEAAPGYQPDSLAPAAQAVARDVAAALAHMARGDKARHDPPAP